MSKIKVGITGQSGFVGTNLYQRLVQLPDKYECISFEDTYWQNEHVLRNFVKQCDVIFHFACLVRSPKSGAVYDTNIMLGNQLVNAMIMENVHPCILFASSIQEFDESEYARCKRETREQLSNWAKQHNTGFAGLIFPNLFGKFARPNSHSFIATFCYKLTHGEHPQVLVDNSVSLKFVDNLVQEMLVTLDQLWIEKFNKSVRFQPDFTMKVTKVLDILNSYKIQYLDKGKAPELKTDAEKFLFETFKSYIEYVL
ncbi:NAD-dependent epimerase/dehydratase family protein [uncultured Bacteroides sp.]|uniref:NAD-dependent epimerase/dehydratase family protein n=1 Tax=uncultured Bacteroides sp. TaxID=162156 RepID=UPI0025FAD15A|nr:NAD-dependent epimerase/dehydratase family protein [uncultured Bacteroides sp.]